MSHFKKPPTIEPAGRPLRRPTTTRPLAASPESDVAHVPAPPPVPRRAPAPGGYTTALLGVLEPGGMARLQRG